MKTLICLGKRHEKNFPPPSYHRKIRDPHRFCGSRIHIRRSSPDSDCFGTSADGPWKKAHRYNVWLVGGTVLSRSSGLFLEELIC